MKQPHRVSSLNGELNYLYRDNSSYCVLSRKKFIYPTSMLLVNLWGFTKQNLTLQLHGNKINKTNAIP